MQPCRSGVGGWTTADFWWGFRLKRQVNKGTPFLLSLTRPRPSRNPRWLRVCAQLPCPTHRAPLAQNPSQAASSSPRGNRQQPAHHHHHTRQVPAACPQPPHLDALSPLLALVVSSSSLPPPLLSSRQPFFTISLFCSDRIPFCPQYTSIPLCGPSFIPSSRPLLSRP